MKRAEWEAEMKRLVETFEEFAPYWVADAVMADYPAMAEIAKQFQSLKGKMPDKFQPLVDKMGKLTIEMRQHVAVLLTGLAAAPIEGEEVIDDDERFSSSLLLADVLELLDRGGKFLF